MYQKKVLANGLTLLTAPLKSTEAVTVLVLVPVGSRYEVPDINGVSHFVEHLLFKGTTRRPTSLDITKELDAVGAEYNAFTSKDHTGYYVKVAANDIERAFDILSDMLFHSTFDAAEIEKERGVIIEEINMYNDNPLMMLGNYFEEQVFSGNPLSWFISGPKEVIAQVPRQKIIEYKERHYHPSRMVVTVAGSFKSEDVEALTTTYFGAKAGDAATTLFPKMVIDQAEPRTKVVFKETDQVQLGLGFPAYPLSDKRDYPLSLLSVILGGNMSSRLFTEVREKNGLAYYIKTDVSAYQDTGSFMVQAGLDKSRIDQAITLILAELKKIADHGVTEKELATAKDFLRGRTVLALEDSETVADWYSKQQLLQDKIETPDEKLKKIFAVTLAEVQAVAQELFSEKKINLALIGPFKEDQRFKGLLHF